MQQQIIFFCNASLNFDLPGTLKVILYHKSWLHVSSDNKYLPLLDGDLYLDANFTKSTYVNFVMIDCYSNEYHDQHIDKLFAVLKEDKTVVICLSSTNRNSMQSIRRMFIELEKHEIKNPAIIICDSAHETMDESLIHYAVEAGALLIDGFTDGVCLGMAIILETIQYNHKRNC